MGDLQVNLLPKDERSRESHTIALEIRERISALSLPDGAAVKVVEPPPGPPVIATMLAEIYGPDAEARRAVASKVRDAFASVPYIVDIDDSFGNPAPRLRLTLDDANLDFRKVEPADVYGTIALLYGGATVGYSRRSDGRDPIAIRLAPSKADRVIDERALATPVPANLLPDDRSVIELGDVVNITSETASFPIFRHNGKPAEMVTAELAGEWDVTWVTFRDMGAAFGVALVGIYILVVMQFGSFKLPLVVLSRYL